MQSATTSKMTPVLDSVTIHYQGEHEGNMYKYKYYYYLRNIDLMQYF